MAAKKMEVLQLEACKKALKPRPKNAHKGMFGHVLVIGGDYGMAGAALLAGEAALRVGAGAVTVATRPEHAHHIFSVVPELMTLALKTPSDLDPLLHRASIILLGPGLGQKDWGRDLFQYMLRPQSPWREKKWVVDADALNLLSSIPHSEPHDNWILTPHPGEAARLLGCSIEAIQHDRAQSVVALQKQCQGTVVLKGAGTLIKGKSGKIKRCHQGNPGMASPGMGDILAGLIAGLSAQGLSSIEASALAVILHATAGDLVSEMQGEIGILASDLLGNIPQCLTN